MKSAEPITTATRDRYLLQVDGVGCLMLLTDDHVTIGGVEDVETCDVSLQASDVRSPIKIDRQGDRYLARADSTFQVDGKPATSKLLLPGNALGIGSRGRLRFLKPVPASATALLRPTAAPLTRRDARYVVLMRESLIFGPIGAHLRIPNARNTVALFIENDCFSLRLLHGEADSAVPLPLNELVNFEDIQVVIRRLEFSTKEAPNADI